MIPTLQYYFPSVKQPIKGTYRRGEEASRYSLELHLYEHFHLIERLAFIEKIERVSSFGTLLIFSAFYFSKIIPEVKY